ncbi:MAG TPA: hypothetical protein LFW14_00070 [Rickettsia endosymbiont of Degeeriella rufa]|nr:hypothetical protein [Rickettsia endosymbiont of Columbicola hoogstraali]HJD62008.1 hypothetical protein [Rickettsia endosymbiont of Degeeriella rufa]
MLSLAAKLTNCGKAGLSEELKANLDISSCDTITPVFNLRTFLTIFNAY